MDNSSAHGSKQWDCKFDLLKLTSSDTLAPRKCFVSRVCGEGKSLNMPLKIIMLDTDKLVVLQALLLVTEFTIVITCFVLLFFIWKSCAKVVFLLTRLKVSYAQRNIWQLTKKCLHRAVNVGVVHKATLTLYYKTWDVYFCLHLFWVMSRGIGYGDGLRNNTTEIICRNVVWKIVLHPEQRWKYES